MAYAPNTRAAHSSGVLARLHALRAAFQTLMHQRSVYNCTARELQALSDRELGDLGIHRSEIPRIAAEAAFKSQG